MNLNEQIQFRLFQMPCCGHALCWVNPRLPSYCPACGKGCYIQLKQQAEHTVMDCTAWIRTEPSKKDKQT